MSADRKPMSTDRTIHICPLLDDSALYLERMFEDDPKAMRWMLCYAPRGRPADDDIVYMRAVAFCPGCGLDVRADLSYRSAGHPAMNELYAKVQRAGKRAERLALAEERASGCLNHRSPSER